MHRVLSKKRVLLWAAHAFKKRSDLFAVIVIEDCEQRKIKGINDREDCILQDPHSDSRTRDIGEDDEQIGDQADDQYDVCKDHEAGGDIRRGGGTPSLFAESAQVQHEEHAQEGKIDNEGQDHI